MTTIYVVMEGEYSDRKVISLWSTREQADTCVAAALDRDVLEFELDKLDQHPGMRFYFVNMQRDGTVTKAKLYWADDSSSWLNPRPAEYNSSVLPLTELDLRIGCWARDEEHAVKIANEKRIQMIALGQWPRETYRALYDQLPARELPLANRLCMGESNFMLGLAEKDIQVSSWAWHYRFETREWQLIIACPEFTARGPLALYQSVQTVLKETSEYEGLIKLQNITIVKNAMDFPFPDQFDVLIEGEQLALAR